MRVSKKHIKCFMCRVDACDFGERFSRNDPWILWVSQKECFSGATKCNLSLTKYTKINIQSNRIESIHLSFNQFWSVPENHFKIWAMKKTWMSFSQQFSLTKLSAFLLSGITFATLRHFLARQIHSKAFGNIHGSLETSSTSASGYFFVMFVQKNNGQRNNEWAKYPWDWHIHWVHFLW